MAEERRHDLNYQDKLPAVGGVGDVCLPVQIDRIEHTQVYRPERAPRWTSWVRVWSTRQGYLRISFVEMTGGSAQMAPSYEHEYADPDHLKAAGIQRHYRWCESRDNGQTWTTVKSVGLSDRYRAQPDEFLLLKDGTLLGIGGVWAGWDYGKSTYDDIGHAMAWRSADDGETWSSPVSLNDPKKTRTYWCHPKQLSDGTIVLPAYGTFDLKDPSPQTDVFLYFSHDGGRTWATPLLLTRGLETRTNDEPDLVELENGDLLVIVRHANVTRKDNDGLYMNCGQIVDRKAAGGWQVGDHKLTNMGFRGFPAVLRTKDNILICAGSRQQFNFSIDNGHTWSPTGALVDPKHPGANHYPILTELPDGRIISIYHYGNHWPYPPPEEEWIHATTFRVRKP